MGRYLPLLVVLLIAGCMHRASRIQEPPEVEMQVESRVQVIPRRCGVARPEWFVQAQQLRKAEGVVADALDLAERRGRQVDELNGRLSDTGENLARIAGLLKKYGCIEVAK